MVGQESVFPFHLSVGSLPLCNKSPAELFRWLSWTDPRACHSAGLVGDLQGPPLCLSPDVITDVCFLQEDEGSKLRSSRRGASALPGPSDQPLKLFLSALPNQGTLNVGYSKLDLWGSVLQSECMGGAGGKIKSSRPAEADSSLKFETVTIKPSS